MRISLQQAAVLAMFTSLLGMGCPLCGTYFKSVDARDGSQLTVSLARQGSLLAITLALAEEGKGCLALRNEATLTINGAAANIVSRGGGDDAGCKSIRVDPLGGVPADAYALVLELKDSTGAARFETSNPFVERVPSLVSPVDGHLVPQGTLVLQWPEAGAVLSSVAVVLGPQGSPVQRNGQAAIDGRLTFDLGNLVWTTPTPGTARVEALQVPHASRCDFASCALESFAPPAAELAVTVGP
jgi:hypothetical protein